MVNKLSWILPCAILMGSLVDAVLVFVYMKFVHQWKDILLSEEILTSQLESTMDEINEASIETSMEQKNEPSLEYPISYSYLH